MARWLVQLEGKSIDLEEFPRWFPDGDVYAITETENDNVYLTGPDFEALPDANKVHEASLQVLDEFSAVISLLWPNFQRPLIGLIYRESDDGQRHAVRLLRGSIKGRSKASAISITGVDEERVNKQTQAQRLLMGSRVNDNLKTAVLLWGDPIRTWPRLYRVLEEIERYLTRRVDKVGLCSSKERVRFRRSADCAEIAGKDARHATGLFDPPKNPMNLDEATAFVTKLLQGALNKAASDILQSENS